MTEEFKEKLVQELLIRQEEIFVSKDKMDIDKIESFSWMDETMKEHLEQNLSSEQMTKFDECARANFAGQKLMVNAIKKALERKNQNGA